MTYILGRGRPHRVWLSHLASSLNEPQRPVPTPTPPFVQPDPHTNMKTKPVLTLDDVKKIAQAAEAEALKNQWAVSIAIVDDGGHLLWLQRAGHVRHEETPAATRWYPGTAASEEPTLTLSGDMSR